MFHFHYFKGAFQRLHGHSPYGVPSPLPIHLRNCFHLSELKLYINQAITPSILPPQAALGNCHPVIFLYEFDYSRCLMYL